MRKPTAALEGLRTKGGRWAWALAQTARGLLVRPCVCGSRRVETWYAMDRDGADLGEFCQCPRCGFRSRPARGKLKKWSSWGRAVRAGREA